MSTSAHVIVFSMLGLVPPPSEVLAMEDIEFEVIEPEPEPEVEPPPPEPEPEPEPEVKPVRRAAAAPEPEPPPEPETPPPAQEEVADFTGVTLTADGPGAGWTTVVGSGAPLRGPVGKIAPRPAEPVQQAAKTGPVGPRFVPVGSLARKPKAPPGLDALLERNYPRKARMQGVGGKVRVTLRLLPTGRATDIRVMQESPEGFGFAEACVQLLREAGSFSPAFDQAGNAVATEIPFNCSFEVDD